MSWTWSNSWTLLTQSHYFLCHGFPCTLTFLLFLGNPKPVSTSGPLHLLPLYLGARVARFSKAGSFLLFRFQFKCQLFLSVSSEPLSRLPPSPRRLAPVSHQVTLSLLYQSICSPPTRTCAPMKAGSVLTLFSPVSPDLDPDLAEWALN